MFKRIITMLLVLCMLSTCALAESEMTFSNEYLSELQQLNEYIKKAGVETLDIQYICELFAVNGSIGPFALEFELYANILRMLEEGDYDGAKEEAINLQYNASFSSFRAYLKSEALAAMGLYAIGPVDSLLNYVEARRLEAQGDVKSAVLYYDRCQRFMDAYDRKNALRTGT